MPQNELSTLDRRFQIQSMPVQATTAGSSNDHPTESRHVNAVANQLMSMLDGEPHENPEEESQSDSDEVMETENQRGQRYLNSELCRCSDLEEWMVYHHGESDSNSDTS